MKKKYFIAAVALVALASCTSDEFIGENNKSPNPENGPEKAIVFNSGTKATTRSTWTGAKAAGFLDGNFVFSGVKSDGATAPESFVFDQYKAQWTENTANTTESNSNDWEYVGYTPEVTSNVSNQGIKYWDYSTSQYDFAAYSTPGLEVIKTGTLASGKVLVTPPAYNIAPTSDEFMSYSITGSAEDLQKCYISDLVTAYNRDNVNDYGEVVTFSFRSLATKIRLAFFETIPGYSVTGVEFYPDNDLTNTTSSTTPTLFASSASLPKQDGNGTMTITFPTKGWSNSPHDGDDTDYNKAHIGFSGATTGDLSETLTFDELENIVTTTEGVFTPADDEYLGRTSVEASYAGGLEDDANDPNYGKGKYYTILPNEKLDADIDDLDNLMIRIKYTLVSADGSNEEIVVDNATAVIPKQLANWHPNYAYTYIFKISPMTNGSTGEDGDGNIVTGLTPITLNAVVVDSEDGVQETITTVSDPSITTYMAGKVITENDEYIETTDGHPIYIVVNDGSDNIDLTGKAKLYTVELDGTNKISTTATAINPISEKSVDNALKYGEMDDPDDPTTYTVQDANGWRLIVTDVSDDLTDNVTAIPADESPTHDAITLNCASFVPEAGKTYIFQYIETAAVYGHYTQVADGTTLTEGVRYYTSDRGAGEFTAKGSEVADDANGINYWTLDSGATDPVPSDGSYMYKIIKVAN